MRNLSEFDPLYARVPMRALNRIVTYLHVLRGPSLADCFLCGLLVPCDERRIVYSCNFDRRRPDRAKFPNVEGHLSLKRVKTSRRYVEVDCAQTKSGGLTTGARTRRERDDHCCDSLEW